jgi:hypothetical protein
MTKGHSTEDTWRLKPKPPVRRLPPGTLLFELVAKDHKYVRCELLEGNEEGGAQVRIITSDEVVTTRHFDSRRMALLWAEVTRRDLESGNG